MLFKARAFKSPSIDCPERLYSLKVLKGLNEQPLPLRDEMNDEFIFCEAVREAQGVRIARELQLSSGSVRYRMKKAIKRLYNKKQRKRKELLKDIKERYKLEQPVKDSEQQLSGIVVDKNTRDALVWADMLPEQLGLVDAILTLLGKSLEQELQRRIMAINAVMLYCGVEEGAPSCYVRRGPFGTVVSPPV
ncbi:hypothetical protein DL98DRAFT_597158 [Cadophora sp. DSE1049]|nr:hypothetical protein DL98DRAFT_597158 [Cadophora sp. DSE1049]